MADQNEEKLTKDFSDMLLKVCTSDEFMKAYTSTMITKFANEPEQSGKQLAWVVNQLIAVSPETSINSCLKMFESFVDNIDMTMLDNQIDAAMQVRAGAHLKSRIAALAIRCVGIVNSIEESVRRTCLKIGIRSFFTKNPRYDEAYESESSEAREKAAAAYEKLEHSEPTGDYFVTWALSGEAGTDISRGCKIGLDPMTFIDEDAAAVTKDQI